MRTKLHGAVDLTYPIPWGARCDTIDIEVIFVGFLVVLPNTQFKIFAITQEKTDHDIP